MIKNKSFSQFKFKIKNQIRSQLETSQKQSIDNISTTLKKQNKHLNTQILQLQQINIIQLKMKQIIKYLQTTASSNNIDISIINKQQIFHLVIKNIRIIVKQLIQSFGTISQQLKSQQHRFQQTMLQNKQLKKKIIFVDNNNSTNPQKTDKRYEIPENTQSTLQLKQKLSEIQQNLILLKQQLKQKDETIAQLSQINKKSKQNLELITTSLLNKQTQYNTLLTKTSSSKSPFKQFQQTDLNTKNTYQQIFQIPILQPTDNISNKIQNISNIIPQNTTLFYHINNQQQQYNKKIKQSQIFNVSKINLYLNKLQHTIKSMQKQKYHKFNSINITVQTFDKKIKKTQQIIYKILSKIQNKITILQSKIYYLYQSFHHSIQSTTSLSKNIQQKYNNHINNHTYDQFINSLISKFKIKYVYNTLQFIKGIINNVIHVKFVNNQQQIKQILQSVFLLIHKQYSHCEESALRKNKSNQIQYIPSYRGYKQIRNSGIQQ